MRRWLVLLVMVAGLVPTAARAQSIQEGFITSFDGTPIHYYLFLPDAPGPVPVILRTHGWGGSAESEVGTGTLSKLLAAGYAVLTWDQRGFGRSGGQAEIDDPRFEGRDVSALIDQVVMPRAEILKVGGDPVVGMSGGSYAGGIQFVAASVDPRIDALAPEIAWHNLPRTLFPNNVPKLGWDALLYAVAHSGYRGYVEQQTFARGMVGTIDPTIHESFVTTAADNDPSEYYAFYDARSIRHVLGGVNVPTLIIQGTIDTLFPINEGVDNFLALQARGVAAKLLLYNAGHTIGSAVPTGSGADDARQRADARILAFFDRYLKGDASADVGPVVEYQDNRGAWQGAASWPVATREVAFGGEASNLVITPAPAGGGSPVAGNPNLSVASARIDVLTAGPGGTRIAGVPHISGTITGLAPDAFLFFKLVDADEPDSRLAVLDDQVTPYRTAVPGEVAFSLDLNGVSWVLPEGHRLVLEVSTGQVMYSTSRLPGVVSVQLTGTVPVV